jgi:hypothetical protein
MRGRAFGGGILIPTYWPGPYFAALRDLTQDHATTFVYRSCREPLARRCLSRQELPCQRHHFLAGLLDLLVGDRLHLLQALSVAP